MRLLRKITIKIDTLERAIELFCDNVYGESDNMMVGDIGDLSIDATAAAIKYEHVGIPALLYPAYRGSEPVLSGTLTFESVTNEGLAMSTFNVRAFDDDPGMPLVTVSGITLLAMHGSGGMWVDLPVEYVTGGVAYSFIAKHLTFMDGDTVVKIGMEG